MSTSTRGPEQLSRFALEPRRAVGPLRFGAAVVDYPDLLIPVVIDAVEREELEYDEYAVVGLEEALVVYADAEGRIDSVSFYESCLVDGRELIEMGVGELLVVLGAPDDIEAEDIGDELELLYAYDSLGLTIWTVDGRVCVVQASGG
ncbi:hypothetical protein G6O69_04445 [Pseudenhygromyxa sp. WMMC2535]|uniref:hypothetical protein n=1 Tax=Pseudenhygromyxa sp. WMMC2535 TaxID=2712867 RepID=UPI00155513FC|nr:hypothetical protein [Pseudenhygromyxa sp. WMMC2535]NVB37068.1 hypothetical protein [Pseudenhygromyxa sp. WMMC2535]